MTMFTFDVFFASTDPDLHMGRLEKSSPNYYARLLGEIRSTYNSVVAPRPTIFVDEDGVYLSKTLLKATHP